MGDLRKGTALFIPGWQVIRVARRLVLGSDEVEGGKWTMEEGYLEVNYA